MPKTTEQLAASKAGETAESNGFGSQERPLRPSGVYQLKNEAGEVVDTLIVKTHPKFGDSQAAAVERVGYKFVRAAKPEEVKQIEVDAKQLATEDKAGNVTQDDLKGLQARLNALEKENADLKAGKTAEETKGSADGEVKAGAKEEAKAEAEFQLEQRGQAGPLDNASDEGDNEDEGDEDDEEVTEKPLGQQNRTELEATAEREGVEVTEAEDTKAKLAEKIQKARDEKEGK